jgi:hypothetical protein
MTRRKLPFKLPRIHAGGSAHDKDKSIIIAVN